MSTQKKSADLGMSEENQFGPMNQDTDFKYYTGGARIWNERQTETPGESIAGTDGGVEGPAKNKQIMNQPQLNGVNPFDKLDKEKERVWTPDNTKTFTKKDIPELVTHVAFVNGFTFQKKGKSTKKVSGIAFNLKKVALEKDTIEPGQPMFNDYKAGFVMTVEPLGGNDGGVAPQNHENPQEAPVWGVNVGAPQQVSPVNVPGMNQNDVAVANPASGEIEKKESGAAPINPNIKNPVTNKLNNPVVNNIKGGGGYGAARGTHGSRGARASEECFVFNKEAATPFAGTTDTFTGSERRNEQSPWANEGTNLTSYSPEELAKLKKTPEFKFQQPLNTAVPYTFEERLYATDTTNMANGTEFGTWDFFILPTNQKVEEDALSPEEKAKAKEDGQNI